MAGKFEREYSLKIRADASGLLDDLKRIMNEAEESGEGGGFSTKFEESVTKALSSITSMMEAHSKLWVNILETSFAQGASGIAGSLEVALSEAGKIAKKNIASNNAPEEARPMIEVRLIFLLIGLKKCSFIV